jgi:hypothetical protein
MRLAWLLVGFSLLSILTSPDSAFGASDVRTVTVPQAQVWCGPGTADGLYPTNLLRQDDRVQIVEELPSGWLAIRPPAGSFSYISKLFVQVIANKYTNYVVTFEGYPVPVLVGSSIVSDRRPTKIGVKLPRGTQVRGIAGGREVTDGEGTWLPIEPPEGEVRYVRKEEVSKPAEPPSATVVAAGVVAASARPTPSVPPPPPDGDALWRDAEKAERTGRLADAIRLYRLAGDANLAVNRARADEAYRRAHWLQQANSSTNAPNGSYYYPDHNARPPQASPPTNQGGASAVRLIGPAGPGAPAGQLVSTQAAAPGWGNPPVNLDTTVTGRLLPPYRRVGNQHVYVIENEQGTPVMHVTAGPGVDLMSYVNQHVELRGKVVFHSDRDLRGYLLTAVQVQKMP